MKMRRILALGSLAMLILSVAAVAQHLVHVGPGGPGMVEHLASVLSLTDSQKATATQFQTAMQAKATPLFQQSKQQWSEIKTLLDGANPDATQIGEKVIAAHATQTQLKALHDEFDTQLRTILTAEQQAKLSQLQQMRKDLAMDGPTPGHGPAI